MNSRTGCFSEKVLETEDPEAMKKIALERYNKLKGNADERLISCSDDHTLFMWDPVKKSEPVIRLTGHQQQVIMVTKIFSFNNFSGRIFT